MANLAMELRHLAQADRHISEGESRLPVIRDAVARTVAVGQSAELGLALLDLVVDTLAICRAHRALVLQAIAAIERRAGARAPANGRATCTDG